MKINNFKLKFIYYPGQIILLFVLISFLLVSCGPFKPKYTDLRKVPGDPKLKREKNIREGRGFRAMSVLENRGRAGNFQFASSNELWRASLELLEFTPLSNVDYSGGIIITDWFSESSDEDPVKITIRFLSNEIRADGLKVIIHKKICKKNDKDNCKIIQQEGNTLGQEIKLAILKKATLIKNKEMSDEQKNYTSSGAGSDRPAKY
tara:strand:+ start:49 stop:666 length:618 start_codon:yes stop_codon:yes gene_type:complete